MNNTVKWLVYVVFICIASLAYSFANFDEATAKTHIDILSLEMLSLIAIGIGYVCIEYSFKIPAHYIVRDVLSPVELHMSWLVFSTMSVMLFQKFYLNKEVPFHSYVAFILIVLVLIIDMQFKK